MRIRYGVSAMIMVCVMTAPLLAKPPQKSCDADGDGFLSDSRKCGGYDCNDRNASINPEALEICDGIDNNCDGSIDEGACSGSPFLSIAAAGDSITLAYNADGTSNLFGGQTYEQYEVSWALGDSLRVNSYAQMLYDVNNDLDWDPVYDNYAVSGANMIDLQAQLRQIVDNGPYDYVTIFIGHNDICDASSPGGMLSADYFSNFFKAAMDTLKTMDPQPQVVVSSLANVSKLYDAGKNDGWCRFIWSIGNVCRVVTSGNPDYILQADQRTQEYNSVLESLASEYGYLYIPQIYETPFARDDLSDFDCFHPNVTGQNKIANIIWSNGF